MEHRAVTKTPETQLAKARAKVVSEVPWARCGNLLLGIWLQVSIFVWPHTDATRISAWLPGLLVSTIALLAMGAPPMRWLNGFVALWLLLWTVATASAEALTYFNGVACGLMVLILSVIPSKSATVDYRD